MNGTAPREGNPILMHSHGLAGLVFLCLKARADEAWRRRQVSL